MLNLLDQLHIFDMHIMLDIMYNYLHLHSNHPNKLNNYCQLLYI